MAISSRLPCSSHGGAGESVSLFRPGWVRLSLVAAVLVGAGCTTAWSRHMSHGRTALWAGDAPRAVGHFEQAVASVEEDDERRAFSLFALGHALRLAGRPVDAEPSLRQALLLFEGRYGTEHPILVPTLAGLATVSREDPTRAAEFDGIMTRIVASHRAQPDWAPDDARQRFALGRGFSDAGSLLLRADRREEAEALFDRAVPLLLETNPRWRSAGQAALVDYAAFLQTTGRREQADLLLAPASADPDYLRYVALEAYFGEHFLVRWPDEQMPLRVHLPSPPDTMFRDPAAVVDSVRDGILDWTDVARPGVPSFVFVDDAREADIPIVWSPVGTTWFIAFAAYDFDRMTRRFGVSHILVTAKYQGGSEAPLDLLYVTMLHEMGHALGLAGHSPDPGDVMFPGISVRGSSIGLSARDRATLRALYAGSPARRIAGAKRVR